MKPLLTVCIPSFNRAELLRGALLSLAPDVVALGSKVEVIVSDNASPDHTPDVIKWASGHLPLRYIRRECNVGPIKNIMSLPDDLARGEYFWFHGDDDLTRPGGLLRLVGALEENKGMDYVFVNHSYEDLARRDGGSRVMVGRDFPPHKNLHCPDTSVHVVARWEEIISYTWVPTLFSSLVSHIFRTSLWRSVSGSFQRGELFSSLENTFPHSCIAARLFVGKPVLYLGDPIVIVFLGAQEWLADWPTIVLTRVLEYADFLAKQGVQRNLVRRYRNAIFSKSTALLRQFLNHSPARSRLVAAWPLVARYWTYPTFLNGLAAAMAPKSLLGARSAVRRRFRQIKRGDWRAPLSPETSRLRSSDGDSTVEGQQGHGSRGSRE